MNEIDEKKLAYAKVFIKKLGVFMRDSGMEAKTLGLTRPDTLYVWRKVLQATIDGGGKYEAV